MFCPCSRNFLKFRLVYVLWVQLDSKSQRGSLPKMMIFQQDFGKEPRAFAHIKGKSKRVFEQRIIRMSLEPLGTCKRQETKYISCQPPTHGTARQRSIWQASSTNYSARRPPSLTRKAQSPHQQAVVSLYCVLLRNFRTRLGSGRRGG